MNFDETFHVGKPTNGSLGYGKIQIGRDGFHKGPVTICRNDLHGGITPFP
jgi:hypothetical protein